MRKFNLVKVLSFAEEDRDQAILGAGMRIDPSENHLVLSRDVDGFFPLDADLSSKSPLTRPRALLRWIGFEADFTMPLDPLAQPLGLVQFKLNDDTNDYYWNGASWVVAGVSDWNSEKDIADNIASYGAILHLQKMRIVVNIQTSDKNVCPVLRKVKFLYEARVNFTEDLIYRTLIPLLKEKVRPTGSTIASMPATGTSLTVAQLGLETGYSVVGVESVFDYDADPEAADNGYGVDLFASFAGQTITLNSSVNVNTNLLVNFVYAPVVAFSTSRDYDQLSALPALRLSSISVDRMARLPDGKNSVSNKDAGTVVVIPSPQQGDLEFMLDAITESGLDHFRIMEELNRFFMTTPLLTSRALDEPYRLHLVDEHRASTVASAEDIHTGQLRFFVRSFLRWLAPSENDFVAKRLVTELEA